MEERGVPVDHATIQRWVVKYGPQLEEALHRRKCPVWPSWRMDETYIRVKGQWYYLYRAVGLDHRVGHLVWMTAPDDQRVDTTKGGNQQATSPSLAITPTKAKD